MLQESADFRSKVTNFTCPLKQNTQPSPPPSLPPSSLPSEPPSLSGVDEPEVKQLHDEVCPAPHWRLWKGQSSQFKVQIELKVVLIILYVHVHFSIALFQHVPICLLFVCCLFVVCLQHSQADEDLMLRALAAGPEQGHLTIYDARTFSAAAGNKIMVRVAVTV